MTVQTECPSCSVAATDPRTGLFHETCPECQARAIAAGPEFAIAQAARRMLPSYRELLQRVAGKDWEAFHQRAKYWDRIMREAA